VAGRASPHALGFVIGTLPDPGPPLPPPALAPPAAPPSGVVEAAREIHDAEISARFLEAAGRYLARFKPDQAAAAGGSGGDGSAKS